MTELNRLNGLPVTEFTAELGGVFEHSPWIAERVAAHRPFATARALHDAMIGAVRRASIQQQLDLIRAHPELAGQEAVAGTLTAASTSEQSRLGLTRLAREDFDRLSDFNRRYREQFGFPCIIALRRHQNLASVLGAFEQRLGNAHEIEITTALDEISHITQGRLASHLGLAGGRLSTHVLDTTAGAPAADMAFSLSIKRSDGWHSLIAGRTNGQGRTDQPLLAELDMEAATLRLEFLVGDYFRRRETGLAEPVFLDVVPIQFAIADPGQHYHVPLLCTPWSYSTYRGS